MERYSASNYWTAGWTYPRDFIRQPFPSRRFRKPFPITVIPVPIVAGPGGRIVTAQAMSPGAIAAQVLVNGALTGQVL